MHLQKLLIVFTIFCVSLSSQAEIEPEEETETNTNKKKVMLFKMSDFKDSASLPSGYKVEKFHGETGYEYQFWNNQHSLRATTTKSASGIYKKQSINLDETPLLTWSWYIENLPFQPNETNKNGEDFVARVYILLTPKYQTWKTKSLVYVWSSSHQIEQSWNSPYSNNIRFIAVADADTPHNQWHQIQRDIQDDFKNAFGLEIDHITGVAIMTDSDDSGITREAWYGDIYFSSKLW